MTGLKQKEKQTLLIDTVDIINHLNEELLLADIQKVNVKTF